MSTDAEFTAKDLKATAGLSYRQLRGWEDRGTIPFNKLRKAGWRRFNIKEVFGLMVCSEVRRKFGVPLEELHWLRGQLFEPDNNYLNLAVEMMKDGLAVWILTDLQNLLLLNADVEIEDLVRIGILRDQNLCSFLLLQANPLVNRLLVLQGLPVLKMSEEHYGRFRTLAHEEKWTPFFGPRNAEIKLGFQVLLGLGFVAA
jgi:DNA-binding transcriptional MerR regulator